MTRRLLAGTFALLIVPPGLQVQAQSFANPQIEEVVVVAARLPRPVADVVGHVDIVTRAKLMDELATDLGDVIRYTPGVSVTRADTRFGRSEITIRGLSGNRVATLIDGVPVPDQFDVGAFANAGQDFLSVDAVSRIEILRGPASTLFGSDALGGVVAVLTRNPEEFLSGKSSHLGASATYSGRDDSAAVNGSAAIGGSRASGVLHVSRFSGEETRHGASGTSDPLNRDKLSFMAKGAYSLASGNRVVFGIAGLDEQIDSQLISVLGFGRRYRNTTSLHGDDSREHLRANVNYEFASATHWLNGGQLILYGQKTQVEQNTFEIRGAAVNPVSIARRFDYDTEIFGLSLDLDSEFATQNLTHRLGWGVNLQRAKLTEQRNGLQTDLASGTSTNVLLGEVLPVRDFPDSTVDEFALYLHDEISMGSVTVIPGLRFEVYELNASADSIFSAGNPNNTVVDAHETSLSPKLGVLWQARPATSLYLQYAHGFRAPPFADVNIGLDVPLFNYRAIANPDLKPERSNGVEIGIRQDRELVRWKVALFGADYTNLIESRINVGSDPITGTTLFQARNVARARVYGAEFGFHTDMSRWLHGLTLDTTASWIRGENRTNGEPLNTIDPAQLVATVTWRPTDRSRFAVITTTTAGQDRIDDTLPDPFKSDGYTVVDVTASYRTPVGLRFDLGVFNLFDQTYWRWSSVRNRSRDDPLINLLSAPGRYASVSVHWDM